MVKPVTAPICPICGYLSKTSQGTFGVKAECCGLWSWNGKPLVDKATHIARIRAHKAFDQVWKSGYVGRGEAYTRLAAAMRMAKDDCHISRMNTKQALQVVNIVESGGLRA